MEFQKKKKKKKSSHNSSSQQREGLFCKPTNNTPGNDLCTCVCLHVSMCVFWKQLNCSLWRSLPMYHPDDSGQAGCAASTAIELNDLVLHWIYCEWPAYHWCLAAGFWKREGLLSVCMCVHVFMHAGRLNRCPRRLECEDYSTRILRSCHFTVILHCIWGGGGWVVFSRTPGRPSRSSCKIIAKIIITISFVLAILKSLLFIIRFCGIVTFCYQHFVKLAL